MGYEIWKTIDQVDTQKYLYHYTSMENAYKILYSKVLRFSNLCSTNDIFEQRPKLIFEDLSNTENISNGGAQTRANGKYLNLIFEYSQKERFANVLTYANEQIASANGNTKNYKYILQSPNGTKLEVYEDYAILYYLKSGYVAF